MANVTMQLSVDSVLQDDTSFEQQLIRVCRGSAAARQALRMALQDSEELLPDESGKVLCGPGDEAMNPGTAYAPCNQNGQLSHSDAQETAEVRRLEQENHTLQEKVKEPQDERDKLAKFNSTLKPEKQSLQDQVQKLRDEKDRLELDKDKLEKEHDSLKKKYRVYQCLEKAWENYQALSEETRRRLDGLFKQCRTSLELLAFGSQEKESTLTSLWEQCRSSHMANGSEFANLKVLFEFFLSMNLAVDGHNGYQRLEAKEGSAYAPDQGMQAINPMSQGQVSTVILAGFKETRTGKIIRKCLVEVS